MLGVANREIALAESQLRFPLPPLLRQVYGVANGGLGPGFGLLRIGEGQDTLAAVYRSFADSSFAPRPDEPGFDQYPWPDRLLPICDSGRTLESWLSAWLSGVQLFEEMFEPGPTRAGINPFTKQPIVIKGHGKPRGAKWP